MSTMRLPGDIYGDCMHYLQLLSVTVLTDCIQSVEPPPGKPANTAMLDLLPATTRGVLQSVMYLRQSHGRWTSRWTRDTKTPLTYCVTISVAPASVLILEPA